MNDTKGTQEEYLKNSFDRFGDDLCGLVLSYLSLKDCLRFECLSKQWQRLVFISEKDLNVREFIKKTDNYDDIAEDVDWIALVSVVKKLPNIRSIDIEIKSKLTESVFEVLINSYKHSLNAIHVRFHYRVDEQIVDRILGKYGPQLTAISVHLSSYHVFTSHTKSLTKLTQLSTEYRKNLLLAIITKNNEILTKNLTKFDLYYTHTDWQRLTPFVDHYKDCNNSLKSLKFNFNLNQMSAEECIRVMKAISQMKTLRELSVETFMLDMSRVKGNSDKIQPIVDYHCEEFVDQWPQLKRYGLHIWCGTGPQFRQLYESVGRMTRLRRLELIATTWEVGHKLELTPKSLSRLKRLTHLSLRLSKFVLNASFFDSIHTYLPHIQRLDIDGKLEITPALTDKLLRL